VLLVLPWRVHRSSDLLPRLTRVQPGGILAYSTCSLNPIENEAVVLSALQRYQVRPDGRPYPHCGPLRG
jgi:16S rRNA C967 or C1407 C5-methylase (RsmB/RsmF family)